MRLIDATPFAKSVSHWELDAVVRSRISRTCWKATVVRQSRTLCRNPPPVPPSLMEGLPESVLIRERFGELFEAARMLLRGGVTQEEQVIPTLAFANCVQVVRSLAAEKEQLVAAWEDPEAWEHEVEIFSWKHASLEPVRVVEGIVVLERLPVYVDIHTPVYVGEWDAKPTAKERAEVLWDREVVIAVYPHPKPASSQHVANLYERALSAAGVSCEESREARVGSIRVEYREDHLLIIVEHGDKTEHRHQVWVENFPARERLRQEIAEHERRYVKKVKTRDNGYGWWFDCQENYARLREKYSGFEQEWTKFYEEWKQKCERKGTNAPMDDHTRDAFIRICFSRGEHDGEAVPG
jgi:hypothetical protein